jgi:hypothetical protein
VFARFEASQSAILPRDILCYSLVRYQVTVNGDVSELSVGRLSHLWLLVLDWVADIMCYDSYLPIHGNVIQALPANVDSFAHVRIAG